jgi:uncharacterized protein YggE
MLRPALALTLAAGVFATSQAAAAEVSIATQGPVVELTINETVEARPDVAELGAGVTTEAPSAVGAMQANAEAMNAVIERIKALGIAERDIQTTGVNLAPQYDYDEASRRQVFRGYQVSNRVQVTLREIDRVGPVLDALVQAGATDLSGPNWSVDDPAPARAQARERAMQTARERALEYARHAGFSDVRLLQVSEAVPFDSPQPFGRLMARDVAEAASTPVEPGRVETGVTVTVTYELAP